MLVFTALVTGFMAYKSRQVELTYDFLKVVPEDDPDLIYYKKFKETFGEDGNIIVIGMKDPSVFDLSKFSALSQMAEGIRKVEGITDVISIPTMQIIVKDTAAKKFSLQKLFSSPPASQVELDSLLQVAKDNKFYKGLLLNEQNHATLLAVTMDRGYLNSIRRQKVVSDMMKYCDDFRKGTEVQLHFAGLPYVRSIMVGKVQKEFLLFLWLSVLVTSLILFFFFRSLLSVLFTFMVIVITVFWTTGTLVLLNYKMTLLTGMLPALIIVIGIPNCIYMYNKYHQEYKRHGNKIKAVSRIIQKIGFLTFMTNANTAVGFLVLYFTDITIIKEFGMVAGILSIATFFITLAVIPPLLVILPSPSSKQLKHLDLKFLGNIKVYLEHFVLQYRRLIYISTFISLAIAFYGISRIQSVSYMVDDLPENSNVKTDLLFFEKNFKGVMPLEVLVDLGKKKAVLKLANLKILEEFDTFLNSLKDVSPPISILNIVKGATQAFYNNDPESYRLPSNQERPFILKYLSGKSEATGLIRSFVDSTGRYVRFTAKVADIGTNKMNVLVKDVIEPKARQIFKDKGFDVRITGTTLLFLKGNQYLIDDLSGSLVFAFVLISLMMAMLFTNVRMIIISIIPNVIPMIITAGIMGLFNIPLKPSTALIFSISFGISIDSTIHFLSKYKQDLKIYEGNVLQAVKSSLNDASVSMIYTSIVLFCGFIIFAFSDFGGTVALGVLTSITLFFAMITNLTLLPALLLTFTKSRRENLYPVMQESLSHNYDENDDEEIDVKKVKKKRTFWPGKKTPKA
jgi:predicted RND superfamily exporter protein